MDKETSGCEAKVSMQVNEVVKPKKCETAAAQILSETVDDEPEL